MAQSTFFQFLDKPERKAEKGSGDDTHNFMGPPYGSYRVDSTDMPEFYKLYCDHIHKNGPLTMTEKGTKIGAMRVDLDFIYNGVQETHKHTQEQVVAFMKDYMSEAKRYLKIEGVTEVFVLEKDQPTFEKIKNRSKSGIHIVIPSLKTNRYIEETIRRALVQNMESYFPKLGLADDWKKVYDPSPLTHTSNWTLLGSKKKDPNAQCYEVRYILNYDPADGEVEVETVDRYDIMRMVTPEMVRKFSIRADPSEETPLTEEGKSLSREDDETRISGGKAMVPTRGRPLTRGDPGSRGSSPMRMLQPLSEMLKKYYYAHAMNLNHMRWEDYDKWIAVGHCLKNIHPDLESTWLEFSSQFKNYNERESISKWNSFGFRNDGARAGVDTLRKWSREDNPGRYEDIEKTNIVKLVEESAKTGTEHDVALVVYSMFRDDFVCARFSASAWYRFLGHTWKETDKGVSLYVRLSDAVWRKYREQEIEYGKSSLDMPDCGHGGKKEFDANCAKCNAEKMKATFLTICLKLKTTKFKENVMKECRELFLNEEFAEKLDENKNLMAFRNGVFDVATMTFRDGKPEDCVSFCTNLDYDPDRPYYSYDCWDELNQFLHDVLPDHEVRTYFLSYLSTVLSGFNEAQKFHILTGSGSNGKSMLMNLMSTALGDYCCKAPISLLTQARNKSSAAAPELVRMKGRRFVTMQEPDEQVSINTGLMKELASSEKITCRDLYQGSKQMIDFDLQARFNFACNEKPKITTQDGGTWRRLVVIDFPTKFVHDPKLPHEKRIDESFVQKVVSPEWATVFMTYLIHLFKEGHGFRKLTPPEKVMVYTSEYKDDNDLIAKFMTDRIQIVEETDETMVVNKNDVSIAFQEWKRNNEAGRIAAGEMFKRLEARFGKLPKGGWTGFRIV